MTYLKPEFDSYPGGSALVPGSFATVPVDLSGERPAGIPDWALSIGGNYTFALDDQTNLVLATDFKHEGAVQIAQGLPQYKRDVDNLSASMTVEFD